MNHCPPTLYYFRQILLVDRSVLGGAAIDVYRLPVYVYRSLQLDFSGPCLETWILQCLAYISKHGRRHSETLIFNYRFQCTPAPPFTIYSYHFFHGTRSLILLRVGGVSGKKQCCRSGSGLFGSPGSGSFIHKKTLVILIFSLYKIV